MDSIFEKGNKNKNVIHLYELLKSRKINHLTYGENTYRIVKKKIHKVITGYYISLDLDSESNPHHLIMNFMADKAAITDDTVSYDGYTLTP